MAAEPRILRTEAEQRLIEEFDAVFADLPGGEQVKAHRRAAFERFRVNGLPHRRIEEWKYTDLRVLMRRAAPLAGRPSDETARAALNLGPDPLAGLDRYRLVIVDGHFNETLSDRDLLFKNEGVEVATTADLLAEDTIAVLGEPVLAAADIVLALNAAFAADGVALNVPEATKLSKPVEIVHVATGETAKFIRNSAIIGAGSHVRLIETHRSPAGVAAQSNVATYLEIGDGAKVSAVRLQAEGDGALHLVTLMAKTGKSVEFDHLTVTAGAAVSRAQTYLTIAGENARISLNGANMLGEKQHADLTLIIDHTVPGSTSRVLYKNIIDGAATGAFQGKIIVEQDAQKTDGKMMNQSLHLSDDAYFASKPELEIYADDVQCGHGSTAGQIDDTMLFYFLSRGIPRAEAEMLLITAFLAEAIETVGDEPIAEALEAVAAAWLSRRAGLARAA